MSEEDKDEQVPLWYLAIIEFQIVIDRDGEFAGAEKAGASEQVSGASIEAFDPCR
ncbi:hypothetical protein U2W12_14050 [Methylomicrobium sp. Wu6]|nr:hypothetical protein [Methylomicrobium sp. Wu6]